MIVRCKPIDILIFFWLFIAGVKSFKWLVAILQPALCLFIVSFVLKMRKRPRIKIIRIDCIVKRLVRRLILVIVPIKQLLASIVKAVFRNASFRGSEDIFRSRCWWDDVFPLDDTLGSFQAPCLSRCLLEEYFLQACAQIMRPAIIVVIIALSYISNHGLDLDLLIWLVDGTDSRFIFLRSFARTCVSSEDIRVLDVLTRNFFQAWAPFLESAFFSVFR